MIARHPAVRIPRMRTATRHGENLDMPQTEDLASTVAALAGEHGLSVAVAESLTAGRIACELGAAPDASTWFHGGVVAYAPEVKFTVLGVPVGPVVTEDCARAMARGVADLLQADLAVAVTGVGGPGDDEGEPAGTVWFAVVSPGGEHAELRRFDGEPPEVVAATTAHALRLLSDAAGAAR
jgi:nicotinamide-nucleotide amidase